MISSANLRKTEFAVVPNGYSIDQVNDIINQAASTIEAYASESEDLYHKMEVLATKIEEYRAEENSIKSALITAEKMADKIKKESEEKAAALIAQSEKTAKTTTDDANAQSEKIISEARAYSSKLINDKTKEARQIILDAQTKANDAINSSKSVAKNVLDQAKEISEDLITKSKQEKEAYDILIATLKKDAADFIGRLKDLYGKQLDILGSANLDTSDEEADKNKKDIDSAQSDVDNLIGEIDEMEKAIPGEVVLDVPDMPEEEAPAEPAAVETPVEEKKESEPVAEAVEKPAEKAEKPVKENKEDFVLTEEKEPYDDKETPDPMAAVEAFSQNEITPVEEDKTYVPEIQEDAQMEHEESLFDTDDEQPFESYFNIKREEHPGDRTETISLVPPEDDDETDGDEPKFKGFFKKKK